MHEHHKKSHKKEEKKSKSEEKKKEMMGKEGGKEAKKSSKKKKKEDEESEHKKLKKKKHSGDHDHEESAPLMTASPIARLPLANNTAVHYERRHDRAVPIPIAVTTDDDDNNHHPEKYLQTAASSTLRPNILPTAAMIPMNTRQNREATERSRSSSIRPKEASTNQQQQQELGVAHMATTSIPTNGSKHNHRNQSSLAPVARSAKTLLGLLHEADRKGSSSNPQSPSNATLLDIIDRLNVSRSDKGAPERKNTGSFININNSTSDRHNELASTLSSPLVRLVNSLARMNQTQPTSNARRQSVASSGEQLAKPAKPQQALVMNKVQFDDQVPIQTTSAPDWRRQQYRGGSAQDRLRQTHQLLRPDVPEHIAEQQQYGSSQFGQLLYDRHQPIESDRSSLVSMPFYSASQSGDYIQQLEAQQLFGKQLYPSTSYLDQQVEQQQQQQQQQRQQQRLLLNAPNPTFNFIDPPMADYDSIPLSSSSYQQLIGSSLAQPPMQTPTSALFQPQQFSFLTD